MIRLLILMAVANVFGSAPAQHWKKLGQGPLGALSVQSLYGDTVLDYLLAGGTFAHLRNDSDTVLCIGQAQWNGVRWDSIAHRVMPWIGNIFSGAPQTYWYMRYQGALYASGNFIFETPSGELNEGFARLNEATMRWEALECPKPPASGILGLIHQEPQEVLYATGFRGSICGYPTSNVFVYDGSGFEPWPPYDQIPIPTDNGDYVGFVFTFQGKTYMTGNFRDPYSAGTITMMRHNGTAWEYVPGWPGWGNVKDFTIRNEVLYIGGAFRMSQGAPGNYVAAFDGESWSDMGGGLLYQTLPQNGLVTDLQWWGDDLVACGLFDLAGGVQVNRLAKWDGQRWCGFPGDLGTNVGTISNMAVWRDSLFICGSFPIGGQPFRGVLQWIGGDSFEPCSAPVQVEEIPTRPGFHIFPNPARTTLSITDFPSEAENIEVLDALGRTVLRERALRPDVEIGHLAPGSYLLQVVDGQGQRLGGARFMKE